MPRTERQIATFMAYYSTAPKEERAWALDHLAKQEKKTPAEIRAICDKYKDAVDLRRSAATPEELKEKVREETRAGLSTSEIHKKYGLSKSVIDRIKAAMRDNGENVPDGRFREEPTPEPEAKQPEAYPGQIYDNEPGQLVAVVKSAEQKQLDAAENDVKIFLPGEKDAAPKTDPEALREAVKESTEKLTQKANDIIDESVSETKAKNEALRKEIERQRENTLKIGRALLEPPVPGEPIPFTNSCGDQPCRKQCRGLWFAIRDQLADFLTNTFGAGTEVISERVETEYERIVIGVKTADGKKLRCTLRAEEDDE